MRTAWQGIGALGIGAIIAAGCGEPSCFVRGTRIVTPRGLRRIEELAVGDEVWSLDTEARRPVVRRVERLLRARATEIHQIAVGELGLSGVTAEHPFYSVDDAAWLPADELREGMRLVTWLGASDVREIEITRRRALPSVGEVDVYNLTIEGPEHNYFAEGILVHNKSSGGPLDTDPLGKTCASDEDCTGMEGVVCAFTAESTCSVAERRCEVENCSDGPLRTRCGCDGKTHAGRDCVTGSKTAIDKLAGACAPPAGRFNCGETTCAIDTQYCQEGYTAILCVDLPASCTGAQATCACLDAEGLGSCGCAVTESGVRVEECKP